jgi:hypothetical protein
LREDRRPVMRLVVWIAFAAAAVACLIGAFATVDRSDDETKIRTMIRETVSSIQKRNLGGAISCVSKDYKDQSGMNYDRLRLLTAQALRVEKDYTACAQSKQVNIQADEATVEMRFAVTEIKDGGSMYKRDLTLHLTKENARHAWIIPVKVWRVTAVDGLNFEAQEEY